MDPVWAKGRLFGGRNSMPEDGAFLEDGVHDGCAFVGGVGDVYFAVLGLDCCWVCVGVVGVAGYVSFVWVGFVVVG